MSISTVAPTANSSGAAALSDAGIGSGLNVSGIVSKLMEVESQPLTQLNTQVSSYRATLSAYGAITSALGTFQSAVQGLNSQSLFSSLSATPANTSVLTATAGSTAVAGSYNVNVTQLAQAQSLTTAGQASTTTAIGSGAATTLTFQFGTISANLAGATLNSSVASSGIAAGSLTLNGTAINTSASTTSATALARQINLATSTTGVTATAQASSSGVVAFTPVTTGAGDSYALTVGNTTVASIGGNSGLTAAQLDSALQSTGSGSVGAALAADGVSFTGTAVAGTLQFTKSDGSNLSISQTLTNTSGGASGGVTGLDPSGTAQTYMGGVTLASATPITVAGSTPAAAGLTAGSTLSGGTYNNSTFTENTNAAGGTVSITSANDSLQGITSAINSANLGVTATIINDGSGTPYHLVLTSNNTGANSSMKISVSGDSTLSNLLSNDPTGTQNLTQSVNAQSTALTVNGIPITNTSNSITGAIQGVTLNVGETGATSLAVAQNSSSVESAVSSLVTAYNTLNSALTSATAYNATTQTAGPLIGDSGVETIQAQMRQLLGTPVAGASQNLNSLAQLGITFQRDGSLALNSGTLQTAITSNFNSVGALFSAVGTASDSLVSFNNSAAATKPGAYAINITQVATQGNQTGSAPPGLTITAGGNDQLSLLIDGVTSSISLAAGTYTPATLAAEVQTAINGSSAIANADSAVNVTVNGSGALSITSKRYGSASVVSLGGDAANTLLGSSPIGTAGLDVEGTIGGNPAVGSGQVLTASKGSPTSGLALTVNGGAVGARGSITFTQGYAYQLNNQLTSFLGSSGPLTVESNSLNNNITSINKQITSLNITLAAQQANYMAEFTALDKTMATMNSTQTFLTQQLASLFR